MILALPRHQSHLFAILAAGLAIGLGVLVGAYGWMGVLVCLALAGGVLVFVRPETAFGLTLATIVLGQLIRIPIAGGESAVIPNDVFLPILIVTWLWRRLASRTWAIPSTSLTMPIAAVIALFGISLLVNQFTVTGSELLSGGLYAVRWLEYLAVLVMGYEYVRTPQRAKRYLVWLIWSGVILALLGFLQLRIFPDFSFMVPKGWDPHVGRLLSTWFDPNFLAGYFALLITVALGIALSQPFLKARWWWTAIMVMTIALVLTFSRSGYVALAAGAGFVTLVRARWLFFLGIAVAIGIVLFVPRVQERVIGIRSIDETAQLRLVSWSNAYSVIQDHPWVGVGYNLYRYTQVKYGFLKTAEEHSASGSDSSLLTIWVTTGFFGLAAYIWLCIAMLRESWQTWRAKHVDVLWRGFGVGVLGGLIGLGLHSLFVNSLLYPHLMQAMWLLIAMVVMIRQPERS